MALMLRKYLSMLGIGSAKIDLVLPKDHYRPGEQVQGYFLIKGGTIEQHIKQIDCSLILVDKQKGTEVVIDTAVITVISTIDSEESNKVDFTFQLPYAVSESSKNISYRFKTKLIFRQGVESFDQDMIKIVK